MMELKKRKHPRLKQFDYSSPGAYFVTICTKERKETLSKICVGRGLAPAENELSPWGKIAHGQIIALKTRYPDVSVDTFAIMPNHIHLLLRLSSAAGASPRPTIPEIVCTFKSITTRLCRQNGFTDARLFQNSFHDHIIRDEKDYQKIWEYIDTNVFCWEKDCFYS